MKGKKNFTTKEAAKIIALIEEKLMSDGSKQKAIRAKIRKLEFYASDFGLGGGYTVADFKSVANIIKESDNNDAGVSENSAEQDNTGETNSTLESEVTDQPSEDHIIFGFDPIVDEKSKVLILGTMPGKQSLQLQQYYANSRNVFWKIIGEILEKEVGADYEERKKMLLDGGIAVWDVCNSCFRDGSLDAEIKDAVPNDLEAFITKNKTIKAIAFNGKEAAKLFGKHFGSIEGVKLLSLPSTSPANAAIPYQEKLTIWSNIKPFLK